MTPKEKAEELFNRFNKEGLHQISPFINRTIRKEMIKQCALILVSELLNTLDKGDNFNIEYWQEVRKEIENL